MKRSFIWYGNARAQLRQVDRETAMRILTALTIYAETGEGDVKALEGKFTGCVLAAGGCDSEERKASSTCWRSKIAARLTEAHRISLEFTDTYLSCQPA